MERLGMSSGKDSGFAGGILKRPGRLRLLDIVLRWFDQIRLERIWNATRSGAARRAKGRMP
jgi:hypothetical protein